MDEELFSERYSNKEISEWYRDKGGQNQLCERSTENDVFFKKFKKKTEGKIPPQILGKRRARDSSPAGWKPRKGTYVSVFGPKGRELSKKRRNGTKIRVLGAREGRL